MSDFNGREWDIPSALNAVMRNSRHKIKRVSNAFFRRDTQMIKVLRNTAGLTVLGAIDFLNKQPGFIITIVNDLK